MLACFVLLLHATKVLSNEPENRLLDHFFVDHEYMRDVRPVHDLSKPTDILLSLSIVRIVEVNTPEQYLRLNAWLKEHWSEEFLTWNPEHYQGLHSIMVSGEKLWQPDTYLSNGMVMDAEDVENVALLSLESFVGKNMGEFGTTVIKESMAIYTVACHFEVSYFPWDVQLCNLTFSSWSKPLEELNYQLEILEQTPDRSLDWTIYGVKYYTTKSCVQYTPPFEKAYSACYTMLDIELTFGRRPVFYWAGFVTPIIIVVQGTYLGVFSITDSAGGRGEKFSLGVSAILALSVFLLIVGDLIPRVSGPTPAISVYILSQIISIAVSIMLSTGLIQLQSCGQRGPPVPQCLPSWLIKAAGNKPLPKR